MNMVKPLLARCLGAGVLAATLAAASLPAFSQYANADLPDWKEDAVPPPPAYSTRGLIELEMPRGASVKIGVDPKTITINHDTGIVRYVVVMRGPSAVNASYEGMRCATAEYRVYARQVQDGEWTVASDDEWKPMRGQGSVMVQYPLQLAREGVCIGPGTRQTVSEIERELRMGWQAPYR
ncbi:MAG: CNP1-like family protein [Pseudomonadota bacterium]|nr:CNP1-like family protein [Pseudomonadota bacterium]